MSIVLYFNYSKTYFVGLNLAHFSLTGFLSISYRRTCKHRFVGVCTIWISCQMCASSGGYRVGKCFSWNSFSIKKYYCLIVNHIFRGPLHKTSESLSIDWNGFWIRPFREERSLLSLKALEGTWHITFLALPYSSCVTFGKSFNLSVSQFPTGKPDPLLPLCSMINDIKTLINISKILWM